MRHCSSRVWRWIDYTAGGEAAFYASLKPKQLRSLEKRFGQTALRQGDIFALPLPFTWEQLGILEIWFDDEASMEEVQEASLLETNHHLTGRIVYFGEYEEIIAASGVISSADHQPLTLEMPHAIFRAANLLDPDGQPQLAD